MKSNFDYMVLISIVAVTILAENFCVYCYFDGERGFFDLLFCGFFVHILVGITVWAIANNWICGKDRQKNVNALSGKMSSAENDGEEMLINPKQGSESKGENVGDVDILVIPGTVNTIRKDAYARRLHLKKVVIMEGVIVIEDHAFKGCKNLICVKIPRSVTRIGDGVFDKCEQLTRIEVDDLQSWLNVSSCGHLFLGAPSHELVNGDKIIEKFEPGDVENFCPVNREAFRGCSSLKEVMFSHSTKKIDASFAECGNLRRVVLPECLEFWHCDFWACSNLTEVSLPKFVKDICGDPFVGVLNVVEIEEGLRYLCGWCVGGEAQGNASVRFREGTCGIARGVAGCSDGSFNAVRELIFPDGVRKIGTGSFQGLNELRRIIFEGRTPVCGDGAFKTMSSSCLTEVVVNDEDWKCVARQFVDTSRFVVVNANKRRKALERERNLGIVERWYNSPRWIFIRCVACDSRVVVDRYYLASMLDAGVAEMCCHICGSEFPIPHVRCPSCGKCHVYGEDGEDIERCFRADGKYYYCSRCGNVNKVLVARHTPPFDVDFNFGLKTNDEILCSDITKWLVGSHPGILEALRIKGYSESEFAWRLAKMIKSSGVIGQIKYVLVQLESMYYAGRRKELIEAITSIMRS